MPEQGGQSPGQGGAACRYCGSSNDPNYVFCSSCGKRRQDAGMPSTAAPAASQQFQPYQSMQGTGTFRDAFTQKCIDRTKTGVTLLIAAVLLIWIPYYINYIGDLLAIIGGILIILGRGAFGRKHARNVIATIIIYIVGIAVEVVILLEFAFTIVSAVQLGYSNLAGTFQSALLFLIVGSVVVGSLIALVYVLAFYELESATGKKLLWIAYAVQIVILLAIFSIIYPSLSAAVNAALSTNPVSTAPITALQSKETFYSMLNAIPMVIYAYTFNIARKRLDNNEIP